MAKRYYWLKLQKDFFKRHDIRIIESMPNGKDYILFYLKMLVESVSHEGELRFSETIPYDENMLSAVTNTNVDIVRSAMKVFIELGMMEILDDKTIYMAEVQKMIGSESDSAERMRKHRKQVETSQCDNNVTDGCHNVENSDIEIDIEKEIDIDIEKEIDNLLDSNESNCPTLSPKDVRLAVELWNSLSEFGIKPISRLTDGTQRDQRLRSRLREYGIEDYKKAIENIRQSDFLQGKSGRRPFYITFDWFVRPNNFIKVLDGNYNHSENGDGFDEWGL